MRRREMAVTANVGHRDDRPVLPEATSRVRSMTERDVPQVVELYERVFLRRAARKPVNVGAYLHEILWRNPWRSETLPSLVYEDEAGRIAGCLGVMPRRMRFERRPIEAAISHTFMVEPGSRSSLAALALARAFLSGSQDLSIAEGGHPSSRILERFGGSTSILYSLRWTRPLRPSRYVLSFLRRHGLPAAMFRTLAPLCSAADAVTRLIPGAPTRLSAPRWAGATLETDELLKGLFRVTAEKSLRPAYDRNTLGWLLDLLANKRERGELQRVAVKDGSGEVVGWYLYYLNPGGISEVVQVAANKAFIGEVLDHLFHHASRGGAVAVSGQMDPAAFQALAARGAFFHHDGSSWFLVHSRHREVIAAIHRGEAFMTRLEGEWCLGA